MNNFIFWKISLFFFHLIGERDEEKVYLNEMDWPSLKDLCEPCSFKTEQRVYRRSDFLCPQPLTLNSFKNWESTKWALFWYILNFTDVTKYKGCQKIKNTSLTLERKEVSLLSPVTVKACVPKSEGLKWLCRDIIYLPLIPAKLTV